MRGYIFLLFVGIKDYTNSHLLGAPGASLLGAWET
jgi:hypothetical protein